MAKKTGFERMSERMFGDTQPVVEIARPANGGERMTAGERRAMEESAAVRQRQGAPVAPAVPEAPVAPAAPGVRQEAGQVEAKRGPGRPKEEGKDWVSMNFRVEASFRQRVRRLAADLDVSINDLFLEGFDYVFGKYGKAE
jgi:hypothetical protein